jgi:hypothetical protein
MSYFTKTHCISIAKTTFLLLLNKRQFIYWEPQTSHKWSVNIKSDNTQGDSWLVDNTARDEFLGIYNQKINTSMHTLFSLVTQCCFNCFKRPPVNRASRVTLRDLEPVGTGTASRSCSSQLALFTPERQREFRPAVEFSKICLKPRSL